MNVSGKEVWYRPLRGTALGLLCRQISSCTFLLFVFFNNTIPKLHLGNISIRSSEENLKSQEEMYPKMSEIHAYCLYRPQKGTTLTFLFSQTSSCKFLSFVFSNNIVPKLHFETIFINSSFHMNKGVPPPP